MPDIPDTRLVEISDAHFRWLLEKAGAPDAALTLPPGGVDGPETFGSCAA